MTLDSFWPVAFSLSVASFGATGALANPDRTKKSGFYRALSGQRRDARTGRTATSEAHRRSSQGSRTSGKRLRRSNQEPGDRRA